MANINEPMSASEKRTLSYVCALIATVRETGDQGAPSGICYAAFMHHGVTLDQYEALVDIAVRAGAITQRGHVLYNV